MKKNKINQVDLLIEGLSENFTKIENLNKLQESEEGKKLFNLIVQTTSEMETFEALFLNYYIPAANKAISESWGEISSSKYRNILLITKDDLKENFYEIIRLGYVGLFHKYESYLKALVNAVDFLLRDMNEENNLLDITDYCKKEYGLDILKSHHMFRITKRVNYIANCVKHWDGLPVKEPVHNDFQYADSSKRIRVEKEQFKADIKSLKIHCETLLSQLMAIGFKQFLDGDFNVVEKSLRPEFRDNPKAKEVINKVMSNFDFLLEDFRK